MSSARKTDKAGLSFFLGTLEAIISFAPLSLVILFVPACYSVVQANALANSLYGLLKAVLEPLLATINKLPSPVNATLGGDYGVFAMLPFLLLYALPTIIIFTALIEVYKTTGLIDLLSNSLHSRLKPFGLTGRDLIQVVMGFGCNVPAIVSTRSCSSCSRGICISAISFGSACSYQLPATLAIFGVSGFLWLGPVYLITLALTTLIYLRLTKPKSKQTNFVETAGFAPASLRLPAFRAVFNGVYKNLTDFILTALPIFLFMCVFAGLLQWTGTLQLSAGLLAPVMALFNLPAEAALAVVLGSIRKDGLAIGLLDGGDSLKIPLESPVQILTAVYLASVLLPCMVTAFTVIKEMRLSFTLKMIFKQASFAVLSSFCIAWSGAFLISIFS